MIFDFSGYGLRTRGYSERPMTFLDANPQAMLSAITEIALLETGSRSAREHWQQTQLRNLINHAIQRSAFWQARLGRKKASDVDLTSLPILTRQDLRTQVSSEGPLLQQQDGASIHVHATSGSSGVPVQFYVSNINGKYNSIRALAQYFMEGRNLSLNQTQVDMAPAPLKDGIAVERQESWMGGALASLFESGKKKRINYFTLSGDDSDKLIRELTKDDVGYLVAMPRIMDIISSVSDLTFLKAANTAMWIPLGENVDRKLVELFADLAIPVRATYSSEEVGMVGVECTTFSGYYHVATSNVIVEVVDRRFEIDGMDFGKVLVTHLHSYATPFIRYDVGDLACMRQNCPCGHDGPTIYNLEGRASRVIKHRDGRLSSFRVRNKSLAALADFTEYRMRQTAFDKIVVELGGRSELKAEEVTAIASFLQECTGPEFHIEVKACMEIDWGQSRKRPGFRCEV